MASTPRKSLARRAGAAARKVVSRGAAETEKVAGTAKKLAAKGSPVSPVPETTAKTPSKKAAVSKPGTRTAATKKAATKKAATTSKKASAEKAPAKKAPAKKAPAKKAPAKKPATTQGSAKKTSAKKTPATKAAATKTVTSTAAKTAKKTPTPTPAKKTTVTEAPQRTAPAAKKAATRAAKSATTTTTDHLVVLEAEDPWTKTELKEVRVQLEDDVQRLTTELAEVEEDLAGMIENSGEGAGHDQADVGSASFERDQEMVIVNNARDMLEQSEHALERIADGTYGQCEHCGNAIGKNRLMAFPRATLCLTCKQREERR